MRSVTEAKATKVLAVLAIVAIALVICLAPIEDSAAVVVAIICTGGALFGFSLVSDPRERLIMVRLFCAAFILRLLFTLVAYKTGLTQALGGADDQGWALCWTNSRYWRGWQHHPPTRRGVPGEGLLPENILQVYDPDRMKNMGFHYFATYFYYLLNIPSQMALSFLNCFMNSLTVVILYMSARLFFSEKASLLPAKAAIILPGFLAWSALSIKETWVILFEISVFYLVCRFQRARNPLLIALALVIIGIILGIRFYVAYILIAGSIVTFLCFRSERPLRTAALSLVGVAGVLTMMMILNLVQLDVASIIQSRVQEMEAFRAGAAGKWGTGQGFRTNSGVDLPYDIKTPGGAFMMMVVGSIYLLFSPFPWQMTNLRQASAMPDVILWWILMFGFIIPGVVYTWRHHQSLLISLAAYTLPLILFYSLIFGNVGLAYRQRAQLMPFLLVLAAAGYERRERVKVRETNKVRLMKHLRKQLYPAPAPSVTASIRS